VPMLIGAAAQPLKALLVARGPSALFDRVSA
jgi:hypothetical protein